MNFFKTQQFNSLYQQTLIDAIGGDKVAIRLSPHVTEGYVEHDE